MPPPVAASPRCFRCAYDLRGFAVGDRCPECGETILTLEVSADVPWSLAVAIGSAGFAWLSMLMLCMGAWPAVLFWLGLSMVGATCAAFGLRTTRRDPHHYDPGARRIAIVTLLACAPGTAVSLCIAGLWLYAAAA